jgi:hypothetical protein
MKLKLHFILLLASLSLKAQVYHPMFTDSCQWNIHSRQYNYLYPVGPLYYENTYALKLLQKDTIVSSLHCRITNSNKLFYEDTV